MTVLLKTIIISQKQLTLSGLNYISRINFKTPKANQTPESANGKSVSLLQDSAIKITETPNIFRGLFWASMPF